MFGPHQDVARNQGVDVVIAKAVPPRKAAQMRQDATLTIVHDPCHRLPVPEARVSPFPHPLVIPA